MNRLNEAGKTDYKKWIIDGKCELEHAACLISGLDPEGCSFINDKIFHKLGLQSKQAEGVLKILTNAKEWHQDRLTIFDSVNTALKNNIDINKNLLAEIKLYFENCIDSDKEKMINAQPYLTRELNLSLPHAIKIPKEDITEKERPQVQKLILGMAEYCFDYKHGASKNIATGSNKGSIRAALQTVGFDLDEGTIKRYLEESYERHPIEKRHKS